MEKEQVRAHRRFGDHTVFGNYAKSFFHQSFVKQARNLGYSHACPVVDNVIAEYGKEWAKDHPGASQKEILQAGADMTRRRYAECNFMFGFIADRAKKLNEPLYKQLIEPVLRREDEPVGSFIVDLVPNSYNQQMSPMSTPYGYALPRVVIEQMGRGKKNIDRTPKRFLRALSIIDRNVLKSKTPVELVVRMAEAVSRVDADPKMVLYHLLSDGILKEQNCRTMFKEMIAVMRSKAPTLARIYDAMTSQEKQDLGIVDF